MRVTIKSINAALAAAGIKAEIVRDQGYFYFTGDAVDKALEQGVSGVYGVPGVYAVYGVYDVARLSDLTIEQWVELAKEKVTN